MTDTDDRQHRALLQRIARRAMLQRGLLPDCRPPALAELDAIRRPSLGSGEASRDLRGLLWCSIDNADSRDLDQLSVAEALPSGAAKVLIAIADVDAVVKKRSALDAHARHNTTSVYTAAATFPMLPETLSTDVTSLNPETDRRAIVVEMIFEGDGTLRSSDLYPATVRSQAKLAYGGVGAWLEGNGPMPLAVGAVSGLDGNLRLQDRVALRLKSLRQMSGAPALATPEARPVFAGDELKDLEVENINRAKDIIEDFMIAANGVAARYLKSRQIPSLRRVVRTPKRWSRIVGLAAEWGSALPRLPDPEALQQFLVSAKAAEEDAARKVERQVKKSAAAILLRARIGEPFEAIVTGAADKGTWGRLRSPPVEGKLESGFEGLDVGHRLRVRLVRADVERGHLDFRRAE